MKLDAWADKDPDDPEIRPQIFNEWGSIILKFTRDDLFRKLRDTDTCFTPVLTFDEVLKNEQVQSREVFFEYKHPRVGNIRQIRTPIKFSRSKTGIYQASPAYGEHSKEILQELGYSSTEIEALKNKGIITGN